MKMLIRDALTNGRFPTFIAHADDIGMGLAICELRQYPGQPRPSVAIHVLEVEEKFRRQGVATALIERVKDFARSHNAAIIELVMKDDNEAAQLYAGLDFEVCNDIKYYILTLDTQ